MTDEDGLMMDSWFKRYMGRLSGDFQLFDWLSLNSHVAYNLRERTHDNDITRSATEVWAFLPIRYPNDPDTYGNFAGRWGSNADYGDRKSTRLNSSHVAISYAVFCLKKKQA